MTNEITALRQHLMLALVYDEDGIIPAGMHRYLITTVLRCNGGCVTKMNLFVSLCLSGTIWESQTASRNETAQSG
jgi:hypothetical protein